MARIKIARNIGFCSGVRRAIDITEDTLKRSKGKVYSLGAVIHNPEVINRLKKRNLCIVSSLDRIEDFSIVILPSHGWPQHIIPLAKKKKLTLIDVTCPYVSSVQKICKAVCDKGLQLVIIGDARHPEIRALKDLKKDVCIIQSMKDIKENMFSYKSIGVISQTTQAKEVFFKMVNLIFKRNPMVREVHIFNTICLDTVHRQEEVRKLAKVVDSLLVIGSQTSANTKRLLAIGRKVNRQTYLVENSASPLLKRFKRSRTVGLISGASTPKWLVKEVVKSIEKVN